MRYIDYFDHALTLLSFLVTVKMGQAGIISCIAIDPSSPSTYAAGSYSRTSKLCPILLTVIL